MEHKTMRYIYTSLLALCMISLSAQEIVVPQSLTPLITKRTATWCIHCGTWGWTLFEGLLEDNSDNAALITAHYSGDLKTDVATALTANFQGISQPRFYLGNTDQGVTSGNIADKRSDIAQQVLAAQEKSPLAQTGLIAASVNDSLEIEARVEFFEAAEGSFYLGVYLVQKEVMNTQTGQSGEVTHKNVLQTALTENWYGDVLVEGSVEAGTTFAWSFREKLPENLQRENLRVLTVIWQENNMTYEVVNANMLAEVAEGVLVSIDDGLVLAERPQMSLFPNPMSTQTHLNVFTPSPLHDVEISVWNWQGRQIKVLDQQERIQEQYRLALTDLQHLAKGTYIIRLKSKETEQIIQLVKT